VTTSSESFRVHVHERGDRSVDGILRLIEIAGQTGQLEELLADMCPEVAAIAAADVVSVYVREVGPSGDVLVMRGNVGFPARAVGTVALRMGEGITGLVAECLRPVSLDVAATESHYKHVPGLGEEHYPAFLGVPLLGTGRVVGVLVLQRRRAEAFSPAEIALATALGAPLVLAIEAARRREVDRAPARSVRLDGVSVTPGAAMGRAAVVPTLSSLPTEASGTLDIAAALDWLRRDLDRAARRLPAGDPEVARALANLGLALDDGRLRERITGSQGDLVAALTSVARDYARVPYRVPVRGGVIEPALAERAREIEDLCVLLWASATRTPVLPQGGVWLADRLGAFVTLCAVARGAAAIVIDGVVDDGSSLAGRTIARAAGIPVISQVTGLFAWARPGDLMVVDADAGLVRVNPDAASVAKVRDARRADKE
jgi:phosphotransferase system enzyme I (PtsP)